MQIRNSELLVTLEIAYLISFPWQWRQDVAETSDLSIVSFCLYKIIIKVLYTLGFQNVAVGRINGVASLTGFSYI